MLVTNDDGVRAAGLAALATALAAVGEVFVVAPETEQSGVAHALTLRRPLRVREHRPGWRAVDGTPTDCVNLAFLHLLGATPDLVVSGINDGYNLADDVLYSGTVAAALEARTLGAPGLAVSVDFGAGDEVRQRAALVAARIARVVLERGLPADAVLNVNVPPWPAGLRITRQGRRALREGLLVAHQAPGGDFQWVGLPPTEWIPDPQADHQAVSEGLISVTPLHSDLTFHRVIAGFEGWGLAEAWRG
ncbi:MAG: 5'/3'-nucleotidase SurE [Acidobacteria bacterium]|nr:5'/3'-nucleotidase SurE [Acidobacteriota bacterium]